MFYKTRNGDDDNVALEQYYAESENDLPEIDKNNPTPGSTVMILTDNGLTVKMKHSSGKWVNI